MFLALFHNGGFGFGGYGAGTATQGIETQAQLNAIRTQLQDNQNADCIKSAIQGNGFALSQLAQTLSIDFNTLQKCCCDVQATIQQVAGQVGFSAERVIAAIERGNSGLLAAVKDCCCQTQKELIQMAGDIKLQNCQMTGELRNGQLATVTIVTPGCGCQATTQVIVEEFMAAFQEQTGLPTNVVLSAEGQTQRLANVSCGSSNCLAIYSSLTVSITPAAAPAA